MSDPLNVIALISGGKDSLYSILHCIHHGHNVVALANLYPQLPAHSHSGPSKGAQTSRFVSGDIDSFMYQTVGYSMVPLLKPALNLPMYRYPISGKATQTGRDYAYTPLGPYDETEDLVPLLREVLQHHPDANAICSGAILSTYQRTRIESVAGRLGLVPLAYLWQYPVLPPPKERDDSITGLLDDMAAAGLDSRIIKIASGGVKESLLWANVANPQTAKQLVTSMSPFFEGHEFWLRGAVLGEGGEYETLTINGPAPIWLKTIDIEEHGTAIMKGEGGVSHVAFRGGQAVIKPPNDTHQEAGIVRVPSMFDRSFADLLSSVISESPTVTDLPDTDMINLEIRTGPQGNIFQMISPEIVTQCTSQTLSISNIAASECNEGAVDQAHHVLTLLKTVIHNFNRDHSPPTPLTADDLVSSTLLLRSMADFKAINAEYAELFALPNPSARVTIACGDKLPPNVHFSMFAILDLGLPSRRRGLHVQSRSYWAPANIGPYSQAISIPSNDAQTEGQNVSEVIHVAGQIPLISHTVEIVEGAFLDQVVLALQHLWRVGQEREVDWWTHGIAYLATPTPISNISVAWEVWKRAHLATLSLPKSDTDGEDDASDGPDAWDLRHNPYRNGRGLHTLTVDPRTPSGQHLHPLPNPAVLLNPHLPLHEPTSSIPPVVIAAVDSLPRSAPVEWHSLGLGRLPTADPQLIVKTTRYESWGILSICSAKPSTTFLTLQIRPSPHPSSSAHHRISLISAAISQALNSLYPPPSPSPSRTWALVHGTAYLATSSGATLLDMLSSTTPPPDQTRITDWRSLALIPCAALWGAAATAEAGTSEKEEEEEVSELSVAITARIELAALDEEHEHGLAQGGERTL